MSDDTGRVTDEDWRETDDTDDALEEAIFYALREHLTMVDARQILADEPDLDDGSILSLRNIASDVRAAFCPPVTPLAPGEWQTVPAMPAPYETDAELTMKVEDDPRRLVMVLRDVDGALAAWDLDAAGIAALETVCRRARAALAGGA